ncbi:MAG: methylmalonyl-CoA epimerase [Candidatus Schekmanbacteria bacterium]|nr:methylmalonyl-CoA epimerase [Candidatus Schekmanbacteria bacterium]
MKLNRIDHIGIAVNSIESAGNFFSEILSLKPYDVEIIESQKVRVMAFQIGESKIEVLEAISDESPIKKFIEKKGEGIHHIAYEVDDIRAALADLENQGVSLIDKTPRNGLHGTKIAFIHPKSSAGILTELVER